MKFLFLALALNVAFQIVAAQSCNFIFRGKTVPGVCTQMKACRGRPSTKSPKCPGKGSICCINTTRPCKKSGKCVVRSFCAKRNRLGKCTELPGSGLACCKTGAAQLPKCRNGSICNLRIYCKAGAVTGRCGPLPFNKVVCCSDGNVPPPL